MTVRPPYADALTLGVKRYENRSWPIPAHLLGRWIVIHAAGQPHTLPPPPVPWGDGDTGIRSALVGAVRFGSVVPVDEVAHDPWALGPLCWRVVDAWRFAEPVPCTGRLGLWRVPEHLHARLPAIE